MKGDKHMNTNVNVSETTTNQVTKTQNTNPTKIKTIGIKIKLLKDFPLVCETLERIGIINHKKKEIYPSCYIRKLDNNYYLCHFKEFFILQDKKANITNIDLLRRATIAYLLQKWGLIETENPDDIYQILHKKIDVLPHDKKKEYKIIHKYKYNRYV